MKKITVLSIALVFLSLSCQAVAQTCGIPGKDGVGSIAGNINTYYAPSTNVGPGSTSIPLGTPVGAAATPTVGDLFAVIQMQCENIDTTNTSNYGAGNGTGRGYTDPAGSCLAGRYQYLRAGPATTATSLDLTGSPLTGAYVQDALATTNRRTYQIIRVAQYSSATLTGNVTAPNWNGSTGGVVLLDVTGTLNMGGFTIDVAGRGFRGGGGQVWNGTADTAITYVTATNITTNLAGFKGEGIVGTPAYIYNSVTNAVVATGTDYTAGGQGKGAPGNAGGGGDNWNGTRDNGGGGGGGNGAIGGFGGYGWSGAGWPAGTTQDLRGIGGAAFAQNSTSRLVMGGGGGAGANNNSPGLTSSGGAGGGIVMIRAGTMTGTGTINANGANGLTQTANDSGGGGGAGGSVLVNTVSNTVGTLTINARGGIGGDSFVTGTTAHAGGGGGSGGVVFSDGGITSLTGANNGVTNIGDCPTTGVAPCSSANGATAGGTGATSGIGSDPSGGGGGSSNLCLPNLAVTKSTTTPLIGVSGATTATYAISVNNTGAGPAAGADIVDNTLPPGWTFASTSSVVFTPALSGAAFGGFIEGATPGVPAVASSPGTVANLATNGAPAAAPVWNNLTIPANGNVVLTYVVNVPATASVGVYHNPAGVKYLDPTRSTAAREVTPATNNAANRAGAQVGGTTNTTYQTGASAGVSIPGSNYSGLDTGLAGENVTLQADLSIVKTNSGTFLPASTSAGGTYTVAVSNVGRAVQGLTYATNQATPATVSTLLGAPYTITDTLPTGMTLASPPTISGTEAASWACTGVAGDASFTCTRNVAAGNIAAGNVTPVVMATITAPVRVAAAACPGPRSNTAVLSSAAIGEIVVADNSSTSATTLSCAANLTVTKTDNKTTTLSGDINNYVVVISNSGPSAADGTVLTDVAGAGLTCPAGNTVTCAVLTGTAICPIAPITFGNLAGAGLAINTFPANSSLQFSYSCNVN
ncbi:MAG: hypothetical protein ABL923_05445 [Burkholderiaceae bacterium]